MAKGTNPKLLQEEKTWLSGVSRWVMLPAFQPESVAVPQGHINTEVPPAPAWKLQQLWTNIPFPLNRVSLDMMSVQANTGPPWEEKNATAIWRGRDSRKERLELVKMSRKYPEIIDAAFTNFFFFKHDESLYGPIVKHISFFDFFKVRYKGDCA